MNTPTQQTSRPLIKTLFQLTREILKQDNYSRKLSVLKVETREIEGTARAALEALNNHDSNPTRNNIQLARELLGSACNQLAGCNKDGK